MNSNDLVPPLDHRGRGRLMRLPGLARAEAGVPPSSPAKLCIAASHHNNKIATMMTEEDGGGASATIAVEDNNSRNDGRHPSQSRWRREVVLPSPALPPSRDNGGSRGAQKPEMYGDRHRGILWEEDEGKGGSGDKDNDNTDGTDNARAGDLLPPGEI